MLHGQHIPRIRAQRKDSKECNHLGQHILLADTRHMVCREVREILIQKFPDALIEEANTPEAFGRLLSTEYSHDVIVVHQLFLAKISSIPQGNLIVLATKPDKKLFLMAREYNARAYLGIGNDHTEDLLRAALHLEPGEFLPDPTFYNWIYEQLREYQNPQMLMKQLTKREREISALRNEGLSYAEIGRQLNIEVSTVRQHIVNIGRKGNKT